MSVLGEIRRSAQLAECAVEVLGLGLDLELGLGLGSGVWLGLGLGLWVHCMCSAIGRLCISVNLTCCFIHSTSGSPQ